MKFVALDESDITQSVELPKFCPSSIQIISSILLLGIFMAPTHHATLQIVVIFLLFLFLVYNGTFTTAATPSIQG